MSWKRCQKLQKEVLLYSELYCMVLDIFPSTFTVYGPLFSFIYLKLSRYQYNILPSYISITEVNIEFLYITICIYIFFNLLPGITFWVLSILTFASITPSSFKPYTFVMCIHKWNLPRWNIFVKHYPIIWLIGLLHCVQIMISTKQRWSPQNSMSSLLSWLYLHLKIKLV